MSPHRLPFIAATLTVVLVCTLAQAAKINLVTVGNPGNAADMRYNLDLRPAGYGRVDCTYRMGKYEVTAGQYTEFLNAVAKMDTYGLYNMSMDTAINSYGCGIKCTGSPDNYMYSVEAADWANRPVNYVSFRDACRFVNWMSNGQPSGGQNASTTEDGSYTLNESWVISRNTGARWVVPTEDEWYKAAYHMNDGVTGNYWDYPTGTNGMPSNSLVNPDPGNNANYWSNGYTIGSPYYRTKVGEFENSESPYGTFDQGGNVWEWNETLYPGKLPYPFIVYRGLRGGGFYSASSSVNDLHAAFPNSTEEQIEYYNIGFRVAYVPEPASASLVGLGGLLLAAIRKRPMNR